MKRARDLWSCLTLQPCALNCREAIPPRLFIAGHPLRTYRLIPAVYLLWIGLCLLLAPTAGSCQGQWRIVTTYIGTAITSTSFPQGNFTGHYILNSNVVLGLNTTYNLNQIPSTTTTTGGITSTLNADVGIAEAYGATNGQLTMSNAKMIMTLTWMPADPAHPENDPAPNTVQVFYRCTASAGSYAIAMANGQTASISGSASCGGQTATSEIIPPIAGPNHVEYGPGDVKTDPSFTKELLTVTNGVATKQFSISTTASGSSDAGSGGGDCGATAGASATVDFCVAGFDQSRFADRKSECTSGVHRLLKADPSYTRWLPLSFSPMLNSQPYRYTIGPLPAPWGNLNCAYSIALRREPSSPNFDTHGAGLWFLPQAGGDGKYNAPQALVPPGGNSKDKVPAYSITDASGERLQFDSGLTAFTDVHSTLVATQTGYALTNAGPPGSIKQRGPYTYTFETLPSGTSPARLLSIDDDIGNEHKLNWTSGLTVLDITSGRQLLFSGSPYFTSVDAPGSGGLPGTHTTLSFDSGGHATSINVYLTGSSTPTHTSTFTYGGPNGDGITSSVQDGITTSSTYVSGQALDPFGLAIPRIATKTVGSSSDTSSSDSMYGTVQGTYSFTYGTIQLGYGHWGVDARTNTFTDARGNVTSVLYNFVDGVIGGIKSYKVTGPAFSGAAAGSNVSTISYVPDSQNPTSATLVDPFNHQWSAVFDGNGNPTSLSNPLGSAWQFGWTGAGNLTSLADPTSISWLFNYGEWGAPASRLTSVVDSGSVVRMTAAYNAYGQPSSVTVPAAASASGQNETFTFAYDVVKGDLTKVTNPLGDSITVNSYDALGDPLSFSVFPDTGNQATSLTPLTTAVNYNAAQAPTVILGPAGTSLQATYNDGVYNQYSIVNQGLTVANLSLNVDTRGRVNKATDPLEVAAQYKFDTNSNVTKVYDGRGAPGQGPYSYYTGLAYGPNNEPTGVTWPGGGSIGATYDAGGRMASITDERGIVSNYLYDNADRLTNVQFPATSSQNLTIAYDPAGRPTSVTDVTGSTTFTYEAVRKRLTNVQTVLGGRTFNVAYTYFPDGKIQTMTSPAGTTSYLYNAAGRLTSLTNPYGETTSWSYDHIGRALSESTSTGSATISSNYSWGVSGQGGDPSSAPVYLGQIDQRINGSLFKGYTLTHSYLGQLLQVAAGGGTSGETETNNYAYDARGRLTSDTEANVVGGTQYTASGSYVYDLANNLQGGGYGGGYDPYHWGYNTNNQVTSAPSLNGMAGATGLTYDASGNLLTASGMTLTWDCWGHLASISGAPGGNVSFTYDAAGRRVSKTVNGTTTYFLYDGSMLIAELDGNGNLVRSYTWGALGLISDRSLGQSRFYLFDRSGNTRAVLSSSGAVLGRGAYKAWGTPYGILDPGTTYAWNGRWGAYRDTETGLLLMGARYYAPNIGRFLSRDPSGFSSGPNLYAYCLDDPLDFFDPNGLEPEDDEDVYREPGIVSWARANDVGHFNGWKLLDPASPGKAFIASTIVGLYDSTRSWGLVSGRYDGGKATAGDVALAAGIWGLNVGGTAMAVTTPVSAGMSSVGRTGAMVAAEETVAATMSGRLGSEETRAWNAAIVELLESRGWRQFRGGGLLREEYIPNSSGGRLGSAYPDITMIKNGVKLRINSVSTLADGITPTVTELANAAKIRALLGSGEHLVLIPKPF